MLELNPFEIMDLTDVIKLANIKNADDRMWRLSQVFTLFDTTIFMFNHRSNKYVPDGGEELRNKYQLIACESKTGKVINQKEKNIDGFFLADIVAIDGKTVYIVGSENETYIADEEMLAAGDYMYIGNNLTGSSLLRDGRAALSFYNSVDGPSIMLLNKSDNKYACTSWDESECLSVHVDKQDNIWANLTALKPRLCVFKQPNLDISGRMVTDEDFDTFTVSDDESKLVIFKTASESPARITALTNTDRGYANPETLELIGNEHTYNVEIFGTIVSCINNDCLYRYDVNDLCTVCHGRHGAIFHLGGEVK